VYSKASETWKDYKDVGWVWIKFTDPMTCKIGHCTNDKHIMFNEQPVLSEKVDVWCITKTPTDLIIECNGIKVLALSFVLSEGETCRTSWSQDVTKIAFWTGDSSEDTATIAYHRREITSSDEGGDIDTTSNRETGKARGDHTFHFYLYDIRAIYYFSENK
jgi:hypothetical protein